MYKKIILTVLSAAFILSSCNQPGNQDENIQSLLDRQAELEDKKETKVNELIELKDSLHLEKEALISQRDSQLHRIGKMETDQQVLVKELRDGKVEELSARENTLRDSIENYKDSIDLLKQEVNLLNTALDSIEVSLSYFEVHVDQSGSRLESGVKEIDQRMAQREARREQEVKNVELLHKRVAVAQKKKEAFRLEREIYHEELDELMRDQASQENKLPYENKIAELDSIIAVEQSYISGLNDEIDMAEKYISETNSVLADLKEQMRQQYSRNEIIEAFIISEKERLNSEMELLKENRKNLLAEQADINNNLASTREDIEKITKEKELILSREMSDILRQQSEIQTLDAQLAEDEIKFLEATPYPVASVFSEAYAARDSSNPELISLIKMGDQLDSMQQLIQDEKSEIAKTRKELAEQRAVAASRRAKLGKTAGATAIILLLGGAGILSLFYYLGRRSKRTHQ